jgi:uncharacterized protein (DUF1800 family)
MLKPHAAIAANRFGLGARPGDAARIGTDPTRWLLEQLEAPRGSSAAPASPPRSAQVLAEVRELRVVRQAVAQRQADLRRQDQTPTPPPGIDEQAIREFGTYLREQYISQTTERHRLAIETDRPFVERLVHFWSNHFAVSADKQPISALAGLYEQEAIRPHVTGNFYEMLLAVERHPAMILYLDNQASMGAASEAATFVRQRRGRELGLNENLAREILELHTLGVDGGYTQHDVTEFAKVLTGWSIGGSLGEGAPPMLARLSGDGGKPGEFYFRERMHEPGEKTILGKQYRERGADEGEDVLRMLATHARTAHHLATKLARHFVADDPPPKLVERLADAYLKHDGDLPSVYRVLVEAEQSWREPLAKFKTPSDFVISAYRLLGETPQNLQPAIGFLTQAGQRPYTPGSPAGWPDIAANWNGGDALLKRIEFATAAGRIVGDRIDPLARADEVLGALSEHTVLGIRGAESGAQGLALLLSSPEFQRR